MKICVFSASFYIKNPKPFTKINERQYNHNKVLLYGFDSVKRLCIFAYGFSGDDFLRLLFVHLHRNTLNALYCHSKRWFFGEFFRTFFIIVSFGSQEFNDFVSYRTIRFGFLLTILFEIYSIRAHSLKWHGSMYSVL